jgi:molecular chaperone DnaJ
VAVQAEWIEKDLYGVLGVAEDADAKTVSRAYRKLARELHPDTHPDDPAAGERFKEVTAAYDVIGDTTKRAEYDEFRRAVAGAGSWEPGGRWSSRGDESPFASGDGRTWTRFQTGDFDGGDGRAWTSFDTSTWTTYDADDLGDLFGSVLGRTRGRADAIRRGEDLEAVLELGFEDAVNGLTTEVTLNGPAGPRTFKVRVPAGVDDGQRIRLAAKGGPGSNGGPPGDLYAVVRVAPHPVFGRSGNDLTVDAPISWPKAVLGTDIDVPTLEGTSVRLRVPPGTPHGRTLRVRGRGVHTAKGTGDLLVGIRVTVPDQLTDDQRQAVEAVAEAFQAA